MQSEIYKQQLTRTLLIIWKYNRHQASLKTAVT